MANLWMYCLQLLLVLGMVLNMVSVQGQDPFGPEGGRKREMVPAMFVFGDSLIDNGNNNDLASLAKANYFPYGIDFNGGPTGRFSNGYTMIDEIAELLGLPLIPAYSEASGDQVLHGVNYASAAAGILDITGRNFVGRIPFDQQIQNFQNTLDQITDNLGAVDAAQALARCIFFVGMGSNDYLNNYLMPNYPTRNQYNAQQYADLLVQQYTRQLKTLYNLGARKFVLAGLGRMPNPRNSKVKRAYLRVLGWVTSWEVTQDACDGSGGTLGPGPDELGSGCYKWYQSDLATHNEDVVSFKWVIIIPQVSVEESLKELIVLPISSRSRRARVGVLQMGCIPSILAQSTVGGCSQDVNQLVLPFNANVKTMINSLNANLPGAGFIYIDIANLFEDIITNSKTYGFSVVDRGCCGIGRNKGQITCLPFETPCPNRDEYVFWDAFHPTEKVNIIMARKAFNGDAGVVYPINIEQLANMN
ncbi:hypothetical protein PTKIN_Ptkin09bG0082300 [Pterospermum kingtungense]